MYVHLIGFYKKYFEKLFNLVEMDYLTKYFLFRLLVSKNERANYNKDFI